MHVQNTTVISKLAADEEQV